MRTAVIAERRQFRPFARNEQCIRKFPGCQIDRGFPRPQRRRRRAFQRRWGEAEVMRVLKGESSMSASFKTVTIATSAILLIANGAGAQRGAAGHASVALPPPAFERTYGYFPRQTPQYNSHGNVYSSESQGPQSFPNPDRDFSIENLRSHPSG